MQQRIFGLLGITNALFHPVTGEDLRKRLVDLNPQDPDALGIAVLGGHGDIYKRTEGADYIKVLHSLLASDSKLLKSTTVDDMFQHHLNPQATAGHQAALASPKGVFFRVDIDPDIKVGHDLGGLLILQDIGGWYGERTLTWSGNFTLSWFIDCKNDLCGIGSLQAVLPVDGEVVAALKQTFRRDLYQKHTAWKEQQQQAS